MTLYRAIDRNGFAKGLGVRSREETLEDMKRSPRYPKRLTLYRIVSLGLVALIALGIR